MPILASSIESVRDLNFLPSLDRIDTHWIGGRELNSGELSTCELTSPRRVANWLVHEGSWRVGREEAAPARPICSTGGPGPVGFSHTVERSLSIRLGQPGGRDPGL